MIINQMLQNIIMGKFANHPALPQLKQMMSGKTPEQQTQTLLNFAKSNGVDPNAKIFSEQDLRMLGLK